MELREFAEKIKGDLQEISSFSSATLSVEETEENHLSLTGISILPKDSTQGVIIYINDYFEDYKDGRSREDIVDMLADTAIEALSATPLITVPDKISSWESCQDMITATVFGTEDNKVHNARISTPATDDLVFIYDIELNENMKIPITHAIFDLWKGQIDVETLHQTAMKNTVKMHPPKIQTMIDAAAEVLGIAPEELLEQLGVERYPNPIVVSNVERYFGAVSLFDEDVLDDLIDMCDGDFYVLPSSIHDLIIVPAKDVSDVEFLTQMVQEVNESKLDPPDRLSNHAYGFDSETRELVHANQLYEDKGKYISLDVLKQARDEKKEREEKNNTLRQDPNKTENDINRQQ